MCKTSAKRVERAAERLARVCAEKSGFPADQIKNPATVHCLPDTPDLPAMDDLLRKLNRVA